MKVVLLFAVCFGLASAMSLGASKEELLEALRAELELVEGDETAEREFLEQEAAEKRAQAEEVETEEERREFLEQEAAEKRAQAEEAEERETEERRVFLEEEAAEKRAQAEEHEARKVFLEEEAAEKRAQNEGTFREEVGTAKRYNDLKEELIKALEDKLMTAEGEETEERREFLEQEAAEKRAQAEEAEERETEERRVFLEEEAAEKRAQDEGTFIEKEGTAKRYSDLKEELIKALEEKLMAAEGEETEEERTEFLEQEAAEKRAQAEEHETEERRVFLEQEAAEKRAQAEEAEERETEERRVFLEEEAAEKRAQAEETLENEDAEKREQTIASLRDELIRKLEEKMAEA
ncbi:axoneme-associated protein mst101(1)-like isoform X1 [Asterias rubens]|uniref:axoneme-associated protein mst101(1)-like isoform X1 n=1 Tax=Asterias rubens TaxID=7604 RepID=UPI001454F4CF|nr:axoneme-associated protein mst101(1)-like isoform X1 [Asterias rubens]